MKYVQQHGMYKSLFLRVKQASGVEFCFLETNFQVRLYNIQIIFLAICTMPVNEIVVNAHIFP